MIYYVVLMLRPWHSLGIQSIGDPESPHEGRDASLPGHGFLPVFTDEAEAREFAGDEFQVTRIGLAGGKTE